jgi:thiamine biosynthesis protein ThiI
MRVINRTIQLPMLRPLLTQDKNHIIVSAKQIGTYEISILPYEDCCTIFAPKNPATKPRIQKAEIYESRFDVEGLIKECVDQISLVEVNESYQFVDDSDHLF